jgi:gliding motility-associated-like protein
MRKYLTLLLAALFLSLPIIAQNLVSNPGFESYNACPNNIGLITFEPNYSNFPSPQAWVSPLQSGSPDYFNTCAAPLSSVHVPETIFGHQYARSGNAFAGLIAWHARKAGSTWVDENREYLQCKLLQPLQAGQRYCVSFYVSPSVTSNFNYNYVGIDNIGINLSQYKIDQTTGTTMSIASHIATPSGVYFTDTSNWIKVSEIFTASGNEQWMTIGCFGSGKPAYTPILNANPSSEYYRAYLFFDDFSIVAITPADTITTSSDSLVCDKNNISLVLNSPGLDGEYIWNTGAIGNSITVNSLGTYWCRSYANCQMHIDTFHVKFDPKIKLSLGKDTGNCLNQPFNLNAPAGFTNLLWSTGASTPSITISQTGVYMLTGTNKCGTFTDTINVHIQPPTPPPIVSDTFLCQFSDQPYLQAQGSGLLWYQSMTSFIGNPNTPYISTKETGNDIVYVTQTIGKCESKRVPIRIKILYQPRKELPDEITMCEKYPELLGKELPEVTYKWSTGASACCVKPNSEGLYKLAVSNECGTYIDTVRVHFSVCDVCITAPNAFTPNNDAHNDLFKAIITCPLDNFQMSIFNRWGNKVFDTRDQNEGWDGSYKGIMCDNGVFVYVIQYRSASTYNVNMLKGSVNLIR